MEYTYESIHDFYNACETCTSEGNLPQYKEHLNRDDIDWVGLGLSDIKKSKYSYIKDLDSLKELEYDAQLGGSCCKFKYDEFDGDDVNYDRLLDGFPAMRKRIRKEGIGSGKHINIFINIAELGGVEYKAFLQKAHTAMQLVDFLEKRGYRIGVYSCAYSTDVGTYKGVSCDYKLKVCIKRPEDPLIKGLILTTISPWFFRYYIFVHKSSICHTTSGMGRSKKLNEKSTKENIYIDNGECLNKEQSEIKIKQIMNLFNIAEETM